MARLQKNLEARRRRRAARAAAAAARARSCDARPAQEFDDLKDHTVQVQQKLVHPRALDEPIAAR